MASLISPGFFGEPADARRTEFDIKNEQCQMEGSPADLIFAGDSITQFFSLPTYFRQFGYLLNRGISGDTAEILAKRLEADVLQLHPRCAVILIGINNTWRLDGSFDDPHGCCTCEEILDTVRESCRSILSQAKAYGQRMILCSVLPIWFQSEKKAERQALILSINQELQRLCQQAQVLYADCYSAMTSENGIDLKKEYSYDGVHPNARGYRAMSGVLTPVLHQLLRSQP